MQLTFLKKSDVQKIKNISDIAFGNGFLTDDYILNYVDNTKQKGVLAISNNNEITGFLLIDLITPKMLAKHILKAREWAFHYFKDYENIAIIKQIAVSNSHQNKGIASKLIHHVQHKIFLNSEIFCCVAWEKDNITSMKNILVRNEFEFVKKINNYWTEDSVIKKYNCSTCGSPPCKCSAEIYVKKKVFNE